MAEKDYKKALTPEEYAEKFVYFGDFGGIDVTAAPPPPDDEDEGEDETAVTPNVLAPVSERDQPNIFSGQPISGTYKSMYSTQKPEDYIKNFDAEMASTADRSKDGFGKYLEQAGSALGAALTPAFGFPVGALGYGMGQLAKKQHRKNAASIIAAGGNSGGMFNFKGQTVSRAPGSKVYTGNLGGMKHSDMYRYEEISRGFIPGTMVETAGGIRGQDARIAGTSGLSGVAGVNVDGVIMDAFGTNHSAQRGEGGLSMVSAGQAQRAREQEFRNMAALNNIDISGMKPSDFTMAAVAYKQEVDGKMKGQSYYGGFFHKTSNMTAAQNIQALTDRTTFGNTAISNIRDKYGLGSTKPDEPEAPPAAPPTTVTPTPGDPGDSSSGGGGGSDDNRPPDVPGGTTPGFGPGGGGPGPSGGGGGSYSGNSYSVGGGGSSSGPPGGGGSSGYGSSYSSGGGSSLGSSSTDTGGFGPGGYRAMGGRIGMQAGGVAAQPAGFVGGPPENFTDGQTVADDQPMSVPEGTFVINAAAVEFAGSDDIKKMLSDAYGKMQKKVDKSIRVAKIPTEDEIDVAVSRGEVIVPPEVAKIIGYDRLEKINNRGKKEVSRRQEAAGGGFLDGKKDGGEVTRPTPKPSLVERRKDEALADVELRADLEAYIKEDKLARLGWDLYSKGEIDMTGVMLRNPKTGKDYGSSNYSGFYFPKKGQEMYPGPVEVAKADTDQTVMPRLGAMQSGKSIRTDIPSIYYYAEKNPALRIRKDKDGNIINTPQEMSRAGVFLTMAHELRHAALNYIHNEGGVKNVIGTPRAEERLMDYYDYHNRRIAAASDSSVPKTDPVSGGRQEFASYDHMQRELNEYYENIAAAALKGRKVPPRAKRIKKNFFERFINELFD